MMTLHAFAHRLEEIGRRAFWMALTLPTRRARRHQQALAGPLRILVIAEDAVGDTILTMPAIRAMH
ncbi:MAG TPA: hypothetical protein VGM50_15455, partial [Gemmatimonadaceae bacterium]